MLHSLLLTLFLSPFTLENEAKTWRLLVYGDSLTAGYGVGKELAFPALLPDLAASHGIDLKVVNAGVSGDTTSGGLRRLGWSLRQPADIMILELGANDGLRGVALSQIETNLQSIITRVREKYPDIKIVLAGMTLPPNLGEAYIHDFEKIFVRLAEKNKAHLIPFILDGVAGRPDLNLPDGIHPTEEGHRIIAGLVMGHLLQVLEVDAD